jgi:hypothetical protein
MRTEKKLKLQKQFKKDYMAFKKRNMKPDDILTIARQLLLRMKPQKFHKL